MATWETMTPNDQLGALLASMRPSSPRADLMYWQHEDTGRMTAAAERPGPRWYPVPAECDDDVSDAQKPDPEAS